jgi:hypothetical protein
MGEKFHATLLKKIKALEDRSKHLESDVAGLKKDLSFQEKMWFFASIWLGVLTLAVLELKRVL